MAQSWLTRLPLGRRIRWRLVSAFGVALFGAGGMIPPATLATLIPAAAPASSAADQLDGADRYSVAIAISSRLSARRPVPIVYLVPGDAYAGAVAAGPAAARDGGAILYTAGGSLSGAVGDELVRLNPARVEVVGSSSAIAGSVVTAVSARLGPAAVVERIAGATPASTAAALSARSFPPGSGDTVIVASADSYWDAVVAGPAAASLGAPLLLVTRYALPDATAAELRRLAPNRVVVVGNTAAVSADVFAALGAIVPDVERVGASDGYGTAAAVAKRFFSDSTAAIATSGLSDIGGIAAVPLAAADDAPILLVAGGDQLPTATRDTLIALRPSLIFIAGRVSGIIRGELIGFSDGRIGVPVDSPTYPAGSTGYHDPGEMLTIIKATEIAYPDLVHVFSIGKSYEGRDIWAAKVSNNVSVEEGEPEVMVDALHHANERLGVEQALYLLNTLTADYATDPYVRRLVDGRVIWIIFAVNPDGWAYDLSGDGYQFWRKNRQPNDNTYAIGTDLNRNYGYKWGCCEASSDQRWTWNFRGPAPFSAPETRAVADFVASRVANGKQQIRTHVSLHTNGELVMYPFGYTLARLPIDMWPDDYAVFRAMARAMAGMNGYKAEQSSQQYPTDGDENDWLYGTYGIFSFTFELYPSEDVVKKGVVYSPDTVIAGQTARNRGALLYLIDAAACPYATIGKAAEYCPAAPNPS